MEPPYFGCGEFKKICVFVQLDSGGLAWTCMEEALFDIFENF